MMTIVLMILGFIRWWPVGLAILAFVLARRRYGWRQVSYAGEGPMFHWSHNSPRWERRIARAQEKVERVRERMERRHGGSGAWFAPSTTGNNAFDEYRAETLRRLEDEH